MTIPMRGLLRHAWARRRDAFDAVAYWSGAARCYELWARPEGAIVLMYHSVADADAARFIDPRNRISPALFERQMDFLSRHRRVVPLGRLVEELAAGRVAPAGTVAITFDDGYRDTLTVAAPILARHRLPATLYLATGYIERAENQWADVVHWCFENRTTADSRAALWGGEMLDLASEEGLRGARRIVHRRLLEASHDERTRLLDELRRLMRPRGEAPRLSLDWDEVRELCRRYPEFELGGHTRNHIDLRTHRGAEALAEIRGCAQDLRREAGIEPRHFSFPYGRWCAETRAMVSSQGWRSAAGDGAGIRLDRRCDPFVLPRVDAPRSLSGLRFKTSGAYPGIRAALGAGWRKGRTP